MNIFIPSRMIFKPLTSGSPLNALDFRAFISELPIASVQDKVLQVEVAEVVEEPKQLNIPIQCIDSGCQRYDENGCRAYPGLEWRKWKNKQRCPLAPYITKGADGKNATRIRPEKHGRKRRGK